MNNALLDPRTTTASRTRDTGEATAQAIVRRLGEFLSKGTVVLIDNGERHTLGLGYGPGPRAEIHVQRSRFYERVAVDGAAGAVESYCDGDWTCSDLSTLLAMVMADRAFRAALNRTLGAKTVALRSLPTPRHAAPDGRFFRQLLGETMTCAPGCFSLPGLGLADATTEKFVHTCRKLELRPGDRLLDLGAGWGAFAIHAARHHGCRVTALTDTEEQCRFARAWVEQARLSERVEVLCGDYRQFEGRYDKVYAPCLPEAAGSQSVEDVVTRCSAWLQPAGTLVLETAVRQEGPCTACDSGNSFLRALLHPGACLSTDSRISRTARSNTDLRLLDREDFGFHFSETCHHWHRNLRRARQTLGACGYDEAFLRLWDLRLGILEAGFREQDFGAYQYVFGKPEARPSVWL